MISDKIENLARYESVCPAISDIVEYLAKTDVAAVAPGSYDIADGLFVNVEEYAPADNSLFEAHREYTDLQYLVCGNEEIDFIHMDDAILDREYSVDIDAGFYREADGATIGKVFMNAGTFLIFEPQDPHRPGMKWQAENVKKLIFKIKVK